MKENLILIPSAWSDGMYRDYKSFGNSHHEGTDQRSFSF